MVNKLFRYALLILIIGGGSYWLYTKYLLHKQVFSSIESGSLINEPIVESGTSNLANETVNLTNMLNSGIKTKLGIIKSIRHKSGIKPYGIMLNQQNLAIYSTAPIELTKAFMVNDQQILLINYNPDGGNSCANQYQLISIFTDKYKLSNKFGNCLPIYQISESGTDIIFQIPQNNPYLGNDVLISYKFSHGKVQKVKSPALPKSFATLSAAQILQLASEDGCYENGVLLDNNACGAGQKYCALLRNLTNPIKDNAYKILRDFCN